MVRGATSPLLPRSPMYSGPPPPTWLRRCPNKSQAPSKIWRWSITIIIIFISVAKLLDGGEEGRDWRALGNLLGYKEVPYTCDKDIYLWWRHANYITAKGDFWKPRWGWRSLVTVWIHQCFSSATGGLCNKLLGNSQHITLSDILKMFLNF